MIQNSRKSQKAAEAQGEALDAGQAREMGLLDKIQRVHLPRKECFQTITSLKKISRMIRSVQNL